MKTGFIGLGAMGASMARNIAKSYMLAAVWNRTGSKAQALSGDLKIKACKTPADLAANCSVICLCVSADSDVLEIIDSLSSGLKPNSVVVDFSTVSSETATQAAQLLSSHGVDFLDSPVSGGVEGARNGTLAMMIGGDAKVLERVKPIMETMAKRIVHMGPVGAGQATKAVNQIVAAGINQAVTEALAFGEYQNLPMDRLIDVISNGAAANWFLEHRGKSMTQGIFDPGFKLKLHHKDLIICKNMAKIMKSPGRVIDATLHDYARLMERGYGDEDISSLYRLKRPG